MSPAVRRRIFICSPFRVEPTSAPFADAAKRVENRQNAIELCKRALEQGHAPFAPHLFYPQLLDDNKLTDRQLGLDAGLSWLVEADEVWALRGVVSEGMRGELDLAEGLGIPVCWWDSVEAERPEGRTA